MRLWPAHRRAHARRRVAILVPSLVYGDATGNDVLGMRRALEGRGFEVHLFAGGGDDALGFAPPSAARDWLREGGAAIFHQATQWDTGFQTFRRLPGVRIVRDHNVTPASFFAGVSADFVHAAEVGAEQRAQLARERGVAWLAASAMNAGELVQLGVDRQHVRVVPPFNQAEALACVEPDEAALRRFAALPADALFVGRLAPNKGHRRLFRVAATYAELFGRRLRLRLVGSYDRRWSAWLELLQRDRAQLGIDGSVELCGALSAAELHAVYLTSRLLLCCSEHEGFCVPLVEAARLGVPVVATWQTAVAETLGPEGLVLRDASDDVVAVAVDRVLRDGALRERLVAAQAARFERLYTDDAVERAFLAAVEPLLERAGHG